MRNSEARRPDAAMNSRSPISKASQEEPDLPADRPAYSVDEAAQLIRAVPNLLYDQMRRGKLSYVKTGRRLITRQHLEQFLDVAS